MGCGVDSALVLIKVATYIKWGFKRRKTDDDHLSWYFFVKMESELILNVFILFRLVNNTGAVFVCETDACLVC